jgi:predicted nucleotidyltransferase component of viral defense system
LNALFNTKIIPYYYEDTILQFSIEDIKVDLVSFKYNIIGDIKNEEEIKIFGLKDIAAMKLAAIGSDTRHRAKDYIDVVYLLKYIPLETMFESYKEKYEQKDITFIKKRLCEGSTVNPYEWKNIKMIDNSIYLSDVPKILTDEVNKYNKKQKLFNKIKKWPWQNCSY